MTAQHRRLAALLACIAIGWLAGAALGAWTASPWRWLGVPAAIAIGWLFVADPTQCTRPAGRGRAHDARGEQAPR